MTDIDFRVLQRKLTDVASEHINDIYPELPPIRWIYTPNVRLRGQITEFDHDDPEAVAQAWRAQLGLDDGIDQEYGIREFFGASENGTQIDLWYVTDRERFDGNR